ncbi:MAG TPA: CBS domain-containing protein [Gemmatimonadales bacterium]|nr:CBS domain-containing protein [Gemmatimonadales bacterium]
MRRLQTKHNKPARRAPHPRAAGSRKSAVTVRDIMSPSVQVLDPALTLRDAVEILAAQHITGAPVVSAGAVVGAISANDILAFEADTPGVPTERMESAEGETELESPAGEMWEPDAETPSTYFNDLWADAGADVAQRFESLAGPEWDVLGEHTVAEAMSQGVRAVSPDTTVADAAAYMLKERVHRAVVLEAGELIGIVTATDIMRAVAELGI